MKKALEVFIGFIHDFTSGCWAATVLVIYWLEGMAEENYQVSNILVNIQKRLFYIGLACVAAVLLTGAGRTFTYISNVYGEDAEKTRKRMLVIKHIFLFIIFGIGIYWQYIIIFR